MNSDDLCTELARLVRAENLFNPDYATLVAARLDRRQAPSEEAIGGLLPPGSYAKPIKDLVLALDALAIYLRRPYPNGLENVSNLIASYKAARQLR